MIAVIADDFTGAAEIGGIGLRHGLRVVIETGSVQNHDADLLIIDTNTRAMGKDAAADTVAKVTHQLLDLTPEFIYKKVDSVLRGNIAAELSAQMKVSGKRRAIVIPANPIFERKIRNGIYYIDDIPLAKTSFSSDPHYPVRSSFILDILDCDHHPVINLKSDDLLPEHGIIIGDVTETFDLENWAMKMNDSTIMAGASGFFNALLKNQKYVEYTNHEKVLFLEKRSLLILGSAFPKDANYLTRLEQNGFFIANMPYEMYVNKDFDHDIFNSWVGDIFRALENNCRVVVAISHAGNAEKDLPSRLSFNIAEMVKQVIEKVQLNELLIEGGSTVSIILDLLNIQKLMPVQELGPGVIRMRVDSGYSFYLTTKPGSYKWPDALLATKQLT